MCEECCALRAEFDEFRNVADLLELELDAEVHRLTQIVEQLQQKEQKQEATIINLKKELRNVEIIEEKCEAERKKWEETAQNEIKKARRLEIENDELTMKIRILEEQNKDISAMNNKLMEEVTIFKSMGEELEERIAFSTVKEPPIVNNFLDNKNKALNQHIDATQLSPLLVKDTTPIFTMTPDNPKLLQSRNYRMRDTSRSKRMLDFNINYNSLESSAKRGSFKDYRKYRKSPNYVQNRKQSRVIEYKAERGTPSPCPGLRPRYSRFTSILRESLQDRYVGLNLKPSFKTNLKRNLKK